MDRNVPNGQEHGGANSSDAATTALDPVCGMTVDIAGARDRNLFLEHEGTTYYFCGKGCKLEFGDNPTRYLDPSYVPSM
ncbi:MAG TPA: YHS domain-containing protein [Candidatus Limnocylindrales bacterium]|nr:YHS domain-containing protein [Candidatus Limnocylindrales bacterium]